MSELHTPRDLTGVADTAVVAPPFSSGVCNAAEAGDEDEDEDEDEPDSLMLDEDCDAPNLVPEEKPRGILAGRIEMLEKIGEGGMGTVWRGHHLKLDRPVAVKILDETLQLRPDGRARFIREARALASLDHRNVARIHDCDELPDGKLFLCMELLDGETLRELIRSADPLDPLEVIDIGLQVCDAIGAAHERGILHRDLTPSNIIRLRDPAKTIKVIDWGLCKYLDLFYVRSPPRYLEPPGSRMVTPYGCRFGSPDYMAPELMRRNDPGQPSFCTDVYSLAVVLYELLTGRRPFTTGDPKKPRPIRSLLPGFDYPDLEAALRVALRFNADDRTQTMAELREGLDLARECLLAQREPPAVSDQVVVMAPVPAPAATPVAAPAPAPAPVAGEAAVREAAPRAAMDLARPHPRGRPVAVALALLCGAAVGVGGTLAAQRIGGRADETSPDPPALASLLLERTRASLAEQRADRCEAAASAPHVLEPAPVPVTRSSPSPPAAPAPSHRSPVSSRSPRVEPAVLATAADAVQARPQTRPPRPATSAQTFEAAMGRLEPQIRGCARKADVPEGPITVQVRRKEGAIDTVKVLKRTREHPLSICVDQVVRQAALPDSVRPIDEVTFK